MHRQAPMRGTVWPRPATSPHAACLATHWPTIPTPATASTVISATHPQLLGYAIRAEPEDHDGNGGPAVTRGERATVYGAVRHWTSEVLLHTLITIAHPKLGRQSVTPAGQRAAERATLGLVRSGAFRCFTLLLSQCARESAQLLEVCRELEQQAREQEKPVASGSGAAAGGQGRGRAGVGRGGAARAGAGGSSGSGGGGYQRDVYKEPPTPLDAARDAMLGVHSSYVPYGPEAQAAFRRVADLRADMLDPQQVRRRRQPGWGWRWRGDDAGGLHS